MSIDKRESSVYTSRSKNYNMGNKRVEDLNSPDIHVQGSTWATIAEAAQLLGVSHSAIRRRLRSGAIQGRREETRQGYKWLIMVTAPAAGISGEETNQALYPSNYTEIKVQTYINGFQDGFSMGFASRDTMSPIINRRPLGTKVRIRRFPKK